jgi:hypothetical protein
MSEHIVELRQNIYPFTERDLLDKNTKLLLDRLKKVPFDVIKADFDIAYSATKHETCDRRLETLAASHAITESTKLRLRQGVDIQASELVTVLYQYILVRQSAQENRLFQGLRM